MTRRVVTSVRVAGPQGAQHVLAPGDEVPDWAVDQITNPAAFEDVDTDLVEVPGDAVTVEAASQVEGEGGQAFTEAAHAAGAPDYTTMTVTELRDLIAARNEVRDDDDRIPDTGKKADLVAALTADDA